MTFVHFFEPRCVVAGLTLCVATADVLLWIYANLDDVYQIFVEPSR